MSCLLEIHSLRKNANDRGGDCSNAGFEESAIYKWRQSHLNRLRKLDINMGSAYNLKDSAE